jgi:hypothetical protein
MSRVSFLLDENLPPRLKTALLRLNPMIDVLRVGDPAAPVLGTPDPALLHYVQLARRILVTSDWSTMPGHIENHLAAGGILWGVFWVRPRTPVGRLAESLHLIWEATEADEWIGHEDWIPF